MRKAFETNVPRLKPRLRAAAAAVEQAELPAAAEPAAALSAPAPAPVDEPAAVAAPAVEAPVAPAL